MEFRVEFSRFIKMKTIKRHLLIIAIISISCNKEEGSVEITRKVEGGGKVLFFWGGAGDNLSNSPNEVSVLLSGAISENIYYKYLVGDIYCVE